MGALMSYTADGKIISDRRLTVYISSAPVWLYRAVLNINYTFVYKARTDADVYLLNFICKYADWWKDAFEFRWIGTVLVCVFVCMFGIYATGGWVIASHLWPMHRQAAHSLPPHISFCSFLHTDCFIIEECVHGPTKTIAYASAKTDRK